MVRKVKLASIQLGLGCIVVSFVACGGPDGNERVGERICIVSESSAEGRGLDPATLVFAGTAPCREGEVPFCGDLVEYRLRSLPCDGKETLARPYCIVRRVDVPGGRREVGMIVPGDSSCPPPDVVICGSEDGPPSAPCRSAKCGPELDTYISLHNSVEIVPSSENPPQDD